MNPRQRPTLPRTYARSTIGGSRLNFRVRNGNGWDPAPMATGKLLESQKAKCKRQNVLPYAFHPCAFILVSGVPSSQPTRRASYAARRRREGGSSQSISLSKSRPPSPRSGDGG